MLKFRINQPCFVLDDLPLLEIPHLKPIVFDKFTSSGEDSKKVKIKWGTSVRKEPFVVVNHVERVVTRPRRMW